MDKNSNENQKFIALLFDPSLCDNPTFYGYEIIGDVLAAIKKVCNYKIIWYQGDVTERIRHVDIATRLIPDEHLTIDPKTNFGDWPFCIALDSVGNNDIKLIDTKMRKISKSYKGLSTINKNTIDLEKQYFKDLTRAAEITGDRIVIYRDEYSDKTLLETISNEKGFHVEQKFDYDNFIDSIYNNYSSGKNKPLTRNIVILNFSLNEEIGIAGSILWDSIEKLYNIKFDKIISNNKILSHDNAFLCLYYASQGIERLQKILIELIIRQEGIKTNEENKMIALLYCHNHVRLENFIKQYYDETNNDYNKILEVCNTFYNKCRYLNYNITSPFEFDELDKLFNRFIGVNCDDVSESIKNNFGLKLGNYSRYLFNSIKDMSYKLNIFVDELNHDSKAAHIFYDQEKNLYKLIKKYIYFRKEIIYSLIKNDKSNFAYNNLPFSSLDIDSSNIFEYICDIISNGDFWYDGEIDALCDEECTRDRKLFKERLDFMDNLFKNMDNYFNCDQDDNGSEVE